MKTEVGKNEPRTIGGRRNKTKALPKKIKSTPEGIGNQRASYIREATCRLGQREKLTLDRLKTTAIAAEENLRK